MIHMTIVQEGKVVADMPEWDGPVPQRGDYIFHPPFEGNGPMPVGQGPLQNNTAGCVKTVQWRTHDRRPAGFVQTAHPYVEITI
jgi:hypothetical protein